MGTWIEGTGYEGAAGMFGYAIVDGEIHILGGQNPSISADHLVYNIDAEAWSKSTALPVVKNANFAATAGKKIYCMGGSSSSSTTVDNSYNRVDIYDTETNRWTHGAAHPEKCLFQRTAVVRDKIYCMAGQIVSSGYTSKVFVYDTVSNTWEYETDMPITLMDCAIAAIDYKIYCTGGRVLSPRQDNYEVFVYDTIEKTWTTGTPMSTNKQRHDCVVIENQIYCVNGSGDDVLIYDTLSGRWSEDRGYRDGNGLSYCGAVAYDGKIYAFGTHKLYIYTPDEIEPPETFTITHEYHLEDGTVLRPNTTHTAETGATYTGTAAVISGYTCVGHRIDGGALQTGTTATIPDVQADHTITFVYRKDEEGGGEPGDGKCCCCKPHLHIPICGCNKEMVREVLDVIEKHDDCCCDCE